MHHPPKKKQDAEIHVQTQAHTQSEVEKKSKDYYASIGEIC